MEQVTIYPDNENWPEKPKAKGLTITYKAVYPEGLYCEAGCVETVCFADQWPWNVVQIVGNFHNSLKQYYDIKTLRFSLYPNNLHPLDANRIKEDNAGVAWL